MIRIIRKYDRSKYLNTQEEVIYSYIKRSVVQKTPLVFIEFTCSTINPGYMFSKRVPEKYVSLSTEGNNLTGDIPILTDLLQELSELYPVKLVVLIGNTDPYYIYTCGWSRLESFTDGQLWMKFSVRWLKYKNNLNIWLKKKLPGIDYQLVSWYELERSQYRIKNNFDTQFRTAFASIDNYFPDNYFKWELNSLKNNFGPGKYFNGCKKPPLSLMQEWVYRKFAEYAVQGLWIKTLFPTAILIQNEKPSYLRTQMYQPLIIKKLNSVLPVIYPFGVDNRGFG